MRNVRAVFVSDAHLGCRYAQASALLDFLRESRPEYLYLVGDIIDGWQLRRGWYWNETYSALLDRVRELISEGTSVCYTPGNHDEFLRSHLGEHGGLHLADEFVHTTADRQRVLVIHGDQFDASVRKTRRLSRLGDIAYNALLSVNVLFNTTRRWLGFDYWSLSAAIKRRFKQVTCFIGRFEQRITSHARDRGCDGVICGHIHIPKISRHDGIAYYNTGDWVESCTALVEHLDGSLELIRRPPGQKTPQPRTAAPPGLVEFLETPANRNRASTAPAQQGTTDRNPSAHVPADHHSAEAGAGRRSPGCRPPTPPIETPREELQNA
ncbi:MAG: UDP-2,3-diacylglucosamine diphosphatase [Planctomycetaceae bacterium]